MTDGVGVLVASAVVGLGVAVAAGVSVTAVVADGAVLGLGVTVGGKVAVAVAVGGAGVWVFVAVSVGAKVNVGVNVGVFVGVSVKVAVGVRLGGINCVGVDWSVAVGGPGVKVTAVPVGGPARVSVTVGRRGGLVRVASCEVGVGRPGLGAKAKATNPAQ